MAGLGSWGWGSCGLAHRVLIVGMMRRVVRDLGGGGASFTNSPIFTPRLPCSGGLWCRPLGIKKTLGSLCLPFVLLLREPCRARDYRDYRGRAPRLFQGTCTISRLVAGGLLTVVKLHQVKLDYRVSLVHIQRGPGQSTRGTAEKLRIRGPAPVGWHGTWRTSLLTPPLHPPTQWSLAVD